MGDYYNRSAANRDKSVSEGFCAPDLFLDGLWLDLRQEGKSLLVTYYHIDLEIFSREYGFISSPCNTIQEESYLVFS